MAKWKATGTRGVRYYEHPSRKHGVKKDRYFAIRYQVDGKRREEGLGWATEGWTEQKAAKELHDLKENITRAKGPRSLKEKRAEKAQQEAREMAEGLALSDFWEQDYIFYLKNRLSKKSSWQKEVCHYERRIKPIMGDRPLKEVTPEQVEFMIDRMRTEGLTPRSQQYAVGTLFRIWKHAARRKLVRAGDNPAAGIKVESVNNTRLRVLTPQNLKDILQALQIIDPAAHDLTMFCAFTGCRFSEAARLTWEHVDLSYGTAVFLDTKNKQTRQVYLVPELLELLERKGQGGTGELVFMRSSGKPFLEPPRSFATAVKHLGLNDGRGPRDKVTFHTLRHTAATFAARRGVPFKDMQILFGWKTPVMVFRYAKGDEKTQRRAMEGLAQSLTNESAKILPLAKQG